ncbi:MAG TPA: tRNA (adenosine(37)-N6)-threonylcarbamoyltransferase complex ATPase subunit type 1 TsaE [Clostridiales bacterium]|nr:MAG: tRNA (adenosine(37)-N6)-threonylcarbamoyltransferase complex ATPase subunit type 1 TsaE [Clostridiales bacterium GWD2_32_19]HCC06655.1 tRNA (adenosine(37)-N6)-threonylcarbamoyltransferase complex ATPase subunit type 1 TsaE [Clostridiales bacterium]
MIYETYSAEETKMIGTNIGKEAKSDDVICLVGDLGVGKTVITKGIAESLNINETITSPTFTIVNEYEGLGLNLYHFDTYRIVDENEMWEIGFDEYLYKKGICVIEWADTIKNLIPKNATWIYIEKDLRKGDEYRKITIKN